MNEKRLISIKRAQELKDSIIDYQVQKSLIKSGYDNLSSRNEIKHLILNSKGAQNQDWDDWHWQYKNCFSSVEELSEIISLSEEEKQIITEVGKHFRWAITPYYVSLMDISSANCPIKKQSIPQSLELDLSGKTDPMGEEYTSPVDGITRRYPDRLIINVTNTCGMYCRHCQRRRNIGEADVSRSEESLQGCVDYIRANPEIRDVLLTGGDALLVSDERIDWLLTKLREIESVEIIRIGSRTPVVMPQRITSNLCSILKKHAPIYLNTHFNNPAEITEDTKKCCDMLCEAGVVLGNQTVLLKGVNDDTYIMKKLNQELLKIRIKPYYVFHPKNVIGTHHFYVRVRDGIEIMSGLRGTTSGLANPTYIINASKGFGKVPIQKNYIIKSDENETIIETWEGRHIVVDESFVNKIIDNK